MALHDCVELALSVALGEGGGVSVAMGVPEAVAMTLGLVVGDSEVLFLTLGV